MQEIQLKRTSRRSTWWYKCFEAFFDWSINKIGQSKAFVALSRP